jgi:hypothetical protein
MPLRSSSRPKYAMRFRRSIETSFGARAPLTAVCVKYGTTSERGSFHPRARIHSIM